MDFFTVNENFKAELTVKRSKFIANIYGCAQREEAEKIIKSVKTKYYDAKHNCYAYICNGLNQQTKVEKYSDDGEPNGTAGKPIMDILKYNNLTNCVLVVTRYFGGILLGTGGLTHAYSDSANLCIKSANLKKLYLCAFFNTEISYSELSVIENLLLKYNGVILDKEFGSNIKITVALKKENEEAFLLETANRLNGKENFLKIKEEFYGF